MTSAIPAWKAELQRRKKERSLNKDLNSGAKDKKKWVDDFNKPVNVIIVSATDIDPDEDFDQDPFSKHRSGTKAENSSSRGVSEEHVSSIKNNPFLKFDQLITSRSPGSPTRPAFLRRQSSGSVSSINKEEPEKLDYKSRSKSVDNLSFKLQNQDAEREVGRVHGKGVIASLRERFGKPASADEFLAVVRKPRSGSQSSNGSAGKDIQDKRKRDAPSNNSSKVTSGQESHIKLDGAKDGPQGISNGPSSKDTSETRTSSSSSQSLSDAEDRKPVGLQAGRGSSSTGMEKSPDQVTRPSLPAKPSKKTSSLSASALISLDHGSSKTTLKRPPSVVDGGEEFLPVVQQSTEKDERTTGSHREVEDETDSIGKLLPQVTMGVKSSQEVGIKQNGEKKEVAQVVPGSKSRDNQGSNRNEKHWEDSSNDKPSKSEQEEEVEQNVTLISNKRLVPSDKESEEKISPIKTDMHKVDSQSIKSTTKSDIPVSSQQTDRDNDVTENTISSGNNFYQTKGDSAGTSSHRKVFRLATSPAAKQSDISRFDSSPKSVDPSTDKEESEGSPFAVKLRKVEKPSTAGIRVVRSSKGTAPNQKAPPKRDVKAVLREQVNGEIIPVTNIDDVELEEESKPAPMEILKVDFEIIGYNTNTRRTSMANRNNKRNRDQFKLRFNDQNVQTHEYQSEGSALKDYIAEHGHEPEEDFIMATGNDDDEEDEDEMDMGKETNEKTMNNNTSLFAQGLQNITKSNNVDLSSFLGRGPHKKEAPVARPSHSPPPVQKLEPEVVATPLDDGDGFSMGSSSALLF